MKKLVALILFISIVLVACEGDFITSLEDYTYSTYDGNLSTTKLISNADFSNREDFEALVFDNKIWVLGGYDCSARGDDDSYIEDVYSSEDGINWTLVTDDVPWKGRRGLAATVCGDYMYISGGFEVDQAGGTDSRGYKNDLWRSTDGITWEEITSSAPWTARMNHGMLADETNDMIYIFGGFNADDITYFADMYQYNIETGEWSEVTDDMGLGARAGFAYCKVGNVFYLQGGSFKNATQSSSGRADSTVTDWASLWEYNLDNETAGWTNLPTPTSGSTRSEHSLISYDDKLWMFSGKSNSSLYFSKNSNTYATQYYDSNSLSWAKDSDGAIVEPRYSYECVLFNDKILLIGGYSNDGPQNDVWEIYTSEDD